MIKDFLLVRNADRVRPEEVQEYLEKKHAPLALSVEALAREMRRYTMAHVMVSPIETLMVYRAALDVVSVVEHVMGGWEGIARFSADQRYLEMVRPDENFMAASLMSGPPDFVAVTEERGIFSSDAAPALKALDFVRRPVDVSRKRFETLLDADAAWATQNAAYRKAIGRRVHSLVGEGTAAFAASGEPFDAVIETWISDPGSLPGIMDEQRRRRAVFTDFERSCSVVATERWIFGDFDAFGPRARPDDR